MNRKCSETFGEILERGFSKISLTELHSNKPFVAYRPNFTKSKFCDMCFSMILLKFWILSHDL